MSGLQSPKNKNTNAPVKRLVNAIIAYIPFFIILDSTIRSKKRQMEILTRARVMKV